MLRYSRINPFRGMRPDALWGTRRPGWIGLLLWAWLATWTFGAGALMLPHWPQLLYAAGLALAAVVIFGLCHWLDLTGDGQ